MPLWGLRQRYSLRYPQNRTKLDLALIYSEKSPGRRGLHHEFSAGRAANRNQAEYFQWICAGENLQQRKRQHCNKDGVEVAEQTCCLPREPAYPLKT